MRQIYLNGSFVAENEAKVSVFDRGFLFGDSVYEVTAVVGGKLIDFAAHMARLNRSFSELDMKAPLTEAELLRIHRELVARNQLDEGIIYLQVTRGSQERDFAFDASTGPCNVALFTQANNLKNNPVATRGLRVVTAPDLRWGRCDIKTTQLLYASLMKSRAIAKGNADDVWMVADGLITEGTSNNAFIVKDGVVRTRPLSNDILHGITRAAVMECAREAGMTLEERAFTLEEAESADEAFSTSASAFVAPVISINGHQLGEGKPGAFAGRLREIYLKKALENAI